MTKKHDNFVSLDWFIYFPEIPFFKIHFHVSDIILVQLETIIEIT